MNKLKLGLLLLAFVLMRCTDETTNLAPPQEQQDVMSKADIDQLIIQSLQNTNEFHWEDATDRVIWSALLHSDSILTVGYKPAEEGDINGKISTIDVRSAEWLKTANQIIDQTIGSVQNQQSRDLTKDQIVLRQHEVLPYLEFKITDIETLKLLRSLPTIRYAEPLGYKVDFKSSAKNGKVESSSSCSNEPNNGIPPSDYTTISPGVKASWHYQDNNIFNAWNSSTGSGITVGLIDTGISPDQENLNGNFNSGYSSGRYVQKYGFYVSSWWWWADPDGPDDQCGHGTAMASVIAAPRGSDGASVGVAYNANLVAVRGTGDVVVNGGKEKTGVSDALVYLGNRSDVRIISMSIGDVFSNSKVADGIRYAYGKGKLIFSAAGTSTSWTNWFGVIFPATMNETVAVTGIKEGTGYQRCDVCHSGSKVDFTVVMERAGSNNHPLSLAMSGDQPSTVGGSSVATATAAGIAALVWAKNPGMTRDQVLNKMKHTADLYPNRSSEYGWGTLNAAAAVNY